ncbi:MAG: hypothetical protein NT150_15025 [Bacteroidetes bacterium]|nr:hypothetical protein [Bacteroidota bacterium]
MALIFYGKGMGQLPKYYQEEVTDANGEKTKGYYSAPLEKFPSAFNDSLQSMSDSTTYVITFFPDSLKDRWDKHLLYIERILVAHKGARIASFFEEDSTGKLTWPTASPKDFIAAQPLWQTFKVPHSQWNKLYNDFKLSEAELDTTLRKYYTNVYFPPYVIIDRQRRIRAMFPFTGLKDAKEITGRLKRLNNEYAAVKKTIEQR